MKTIFIFLFIISTIASQAQSLYKINPNDLEQPESFGRTIMEVIKNGSAASWKELLSAELINNEQSTIITNYTGFRNLLIPLTGKYPVGFHKMPVELKTCDVGLILILDREIGLLVVKQNNRYYINSNRYWEFTLGYYGYDCK